MQKKRKVFLGVALIVIMVVAGGSIFWFFVPPAVDFWIDAGYQYQKIGDNWVTINSINNDSINGVVMPFHCKNYGFLIGTFSITMFFRGVSFSNNTQPPYQEINGTAVKFDFALNGGQEKTINVYFDIASSSNFTISLSLETNQGLFRVMNAQKFGEQPWQQSYRELHYWVKDNNRFVPAVIC